jgi:hypothetical protein
LKGPGKPAGNEIKWDTKLLVYADVNLLGDNIYTIKKNTEALIGASKEKKKTQRKLSIY